MKLNNNNNTDTLPYKKEPALRKKEVVTTLYRHSDISIRNIAQQAGMSPDEVQGITD
ncbi:MAG: hypothetical protein WAM14_15125 [Candidatus Nitrosopolaris sp.]